MVYFVDHRGRSNLEYFIFTGVVNLFLQLDHDFDLLTVRSSYCCV